MMIIAPHGAEDERRYTNAEVKGSSPGSYHFFKIVFVASSKRRPLPPTPFS
jgi:hypothetical protein